MDIFLSELTVNTLPSYEPEIILQKTNTFSNPREALINSIKPQYRKRALALLEAIQSDDSYSIDTTTGQLLHNSNEIGKLLELFSDLWDRKKKGNQLNQTFVQILHNTGLSRFIPKSKSIKINQSTFLNAPFNAEKWYFIGQ